MSKAVVIREHGGAELLKVEDFPDAPPDAGEIAVDNTAIGLNFIDIYQRKGLYPVSTPAILGSEGAGRVAATGAGVSGLRAGDRVAYFTSGGSYRARTVVPAVAAAKIPDAVSDEVAAAVFLKGLTAEMLVRRVFALKQGQSALVYAAAGGVGQVLTQWAAQTGAEVIAVVGNPQKAALAKRYGARHVIIRTQTDSISAEVRKLTNGRGVDVVYDSLGAATFDASLDSLAMRGMMVSYGNATGPAPPIAPLELSRRGSLFLTRPTLFHYATPERLPEMAERLFDMIATGRIQIDPPAAFPLEQAADAHRLLESGQSTGAIILKP